MSKNEKKIEIKIEGKEWKNCLDKAFNKVNKKVKIDGFRPGKASKDIFLKKYGIEYLYKDAADYAIDLAYSKMLKDYKEDVEKLVAYPDITVKEIKEEEISFEFVLTFKPEVKLGEYKNLGIKKGKAKITSEEIQKGVDTIVNKYAENVIKEGKIENGDIANINYEGFVDGKPFEGGKANNYSLKIGSGTFIPGFEEQLIGLSAKDDKKVKVTFPEDYHAENLKGKKATFEVHINEVNEVQLPEFNEEFFEDLAMDNVKSKEDLYKNVEEKLKHNKEHVVEDEYLEKVINKICENSEIDVPEVMVKEETERIIKRHENMLKSQGIDINFYYKIINSNSEEFKEKMKEEALKNVKMRLIFEEIMKKEKIEVTDDEAKEEAEKRAKEYDITADEFIMDFGGIENLKYDLRMRKVFDIIKK